MQRLRLNRRSAIAVCLLAVVAGTSLWAKPRIDNQNALSERWVSAAVTALEYDATDHLRLVAATSPWVSSVTTKSERDLITLAEHLASTSPTGSAAADAEACRVDAEKMWWGDAQNRTEAACEALADEQIDSARMDVLIAYTAAVEQVCGQEGATESYPMAEFYPYADEAVAETLESIDSRLSRAPENCTLEVTFTE